ncbi:MAG: C39 family peptidase [Treponema sp.]|jgi:hypothetical protein|nr:C39 family peptidase [Treponema sp.]
MIYKTNELGKEGEIDFDQTNNEQNPFGACNVTSMIIWLWYRGHTFPQGKYEQPEDNLYDFIQTDPRVRQLYSEYIKNPNNKWAIGMPFERNHDLLSAATNWWMGKQVTKFSWGMPIPNIINEIKCGRPVVLNGYFQRPVKDPLGHIVVMVGYDDETRDVYLDDPYGQTYDWRPGVSGRNSKIPWELFIRDIKDPGNAQKKWAHFFL